MAEKKPIKTSPIQSICLLQAFVFIAAHKRTYTRHLHDNSLQFIDETVRKWRWLDVQSRTYHKANDNVNIVIVGNIIKVWNYSVMHPFSAVLVILERHIQQENDIIHNCIALILEVQPLILRTLCFLTRRRCRGGFQYNSTSSPVSHPVDGHTSAPPCPTAAEDDYSQSPALEICCEWRTGSCATAEFQMQLIILLNYFIKYIV